MNFEVVSHDDAHLAYSILVPFLIAPERTNVSEVKFGKNKLRLDMVKKLSNAIQSNDTVTSLNLGGSNIGDEGAVLLAGALTSAPAITSLDIGWNNITSVGVEAFVSSLEKSGVTHLNLSWNEIGVAGVEQVALLLSKPTKLTHLGLWGDGITEEGLEHITKALLTNHTLTSIDLTNNKLSGGAKYLCALIRNNNTITSLNLRATGFTGDEIKEIFKSLKENKSIQSIDLQNNGIGKESVVDVAHYLSSNPSLQSLNLQWNNIGNTASILVDAIKANSNLTHLYIKGNGVELKLEQQLSNLFTTKALKIRVEHQKLQQ